MSRVRLLFALTASVVLLALLPATALSSGYHQDYCGIVKGSGHWCGASGAHSWDAHVNQNSGFNHTVYGSADA
jgi:hypothetical protein